MKKILILSLFLVGTFLSVDAQIKTPAPSPFCKIEQKVGLTDVTVEYSRPGMKDREIFGGLVPYGEMWRTGANKNTIFTFSEDVTVNGQDLKKGSYAVFVKPSAAMWDVYFYSDTENWGTPENWDEAKVAAKTTAKVQEMPMPMETFTIDIGDISSDGAMISFLWEKAWVGLELGLGTDDAVMASIDKAMAGPDWRAKYSAARYYLENGKDLNKAMEWMNAATAGEGGEKFWVLRQKALLQAKMGKYKDAIATAEQSIALAVKADNKGYQRMNKESIAEWTKMK